MELSGAGFSHLPGTSPKQTKYVKHRFQDSKHQVTQDSELQEVGYWRSESLEQLTATATFLAAEKGASFEAGPGALS